MTDSATSPSFLRRWAAVLITGALLLAAGIVGATQIVPDLGDVARVEAANAQARTALVKDKSQLDQATSAESDAEAATSTAHDTYLAALAQNASDYDSATAAGVANGTVSLPRTGAEFGYSPELYANYTAANQAAESTYQQVKDDEDAAKADLSIQQSRFQDAAGKVVATHALLAAERQYTSAEMFRWIAITAAALIAFTITLIVTLVRRRRQGAASL